MFKSADAAFGIQPAGVITPAYAAAPVQQQTVPATVPAQQITKAPVNNIEVCQGLSAFEPDKIPSTLLNMLPESKMQVTPGDNESLVEHYATWKEMGKMFGKNIASISISPDSEVYKAIKDNDFYTISFTKQDEPETWFMIQCVKQGESTEGTQKSLSVKSLTYGSDNHENNKNILFLLILMCPLLAIAQGHKGSVESCAPMKEGKVCYSDEVDAEGMKKGELFNAIDKWARKITARMFSCRA